MSGQLTIGCRVFGHASLNTSARYFRAGTAETTAVCEPLCGSTPIITAAIIYPFPSALRQIGPRRACLIPERSGVAPLTSHTAARSRQAGTSFGSQAMTGRQRI